MRFGSVCSGIEAASVAWHPLGWQAAWFAEIEPFPCAVLAHHYPTVPNLGDMTTIAKRVMTGEVEAPDVLAGGTPCFTSGHLVLTASGYAPIETIKPGDMVVTHLGRLRRVVRIGSKQASVGTLKAVGLREPLTVTGDHPFLAVEWNNQSTKREGRYARIEHYGGLEWIEAKIMPGRQWCALTTYESGESFFRSAKLSEQEAMYVAGMYLGDGHIRRWGDAAKKALVLSLNEAKLSKLKRAIGDAGFSVSHDRSVARVTICDTALCEWLEEQFGKLSHLKRIPSWVLGHKNRSLLLQGYLDTDGTKMVNGVGISTVSKALAYGAADLMNAEGLVASVGLVETQDTCVIEGRTVNQRDWYQVRGFDRAASRKSRVRHGYLLRTVQSFDEAGIDTVFNIEVEGDNSYVVNGAVVHNCQAFSVAGLRESLADERGNLTLKFVELADAIDFVRVRDGRPPAIVFWENVPGVLSTKDNAFGCFLAGLAGEDEPLRAPGGKWANAGAVYGPARAIAWRTLDAQYFGLPQRRRRVFVVASARGRFDPATVLFEWDGVRRDSAPSREAREGSAGRAARSVALRGREGGGTAELGDELQNCLRASCGGGDKPHVLIECMSFDWQAGGGGNITDPPGRTRALTSCKTLGVLIHADPIARCVTAGEAKRQDWETCNFVAHSLRGEGFDASEDGTGRGTPLVPVAFSCKDYGADAGEIAPTLRSMGHDKSHANAGGQVAIAFNARQDPDHWHDRTGPLDTDGGTQAVAFAENSRAEVLLEGGDGRRCGAISTGGGKPGQGVPMIAHTMQVRRLTPRECARLQGFPDDYLDIPYRNKPAADGPKYKALGNSWAVPVVRWIGERIQQAVDPT